MASALQFDGKVALITGAGAGLGREYALAFAQRGASVVVNDLGGGRHGEGKGSSAADAVVEEIRAQGGKAVPDYHSVEDGEKVVQTALKEFGRIDVLVNNAGILRDKSFARMSDLDWDLVHRVHLRGSFLVTRAAWPHMRKQKYGKIIMTTSTSGIFGNFGQANYSAAKLGLLGLSHTLAIEGQKYNIMCNTVAPIAGSRLTEDVLPQDVREKFNPRLVAPFVLHLCHESCHDNDTLLITAGGWASKLRYQQAEGAFVGKSEGDLITPEMVRDHWSTIGNFDAPEYPNGSIALTILDKIKGKKSDPVSGESLAGSPHQEMSSVTYTANDVILYSLGVGVSVQNDLSHLKFLYEGHENFCVLPSFGVVLAQHAVFGKVTQSVPHLNIDPARILHGEQYLEVFKPLQTSGTVFNSIKVVDVMDKRRGAVILVDVTTKDEAGEPICYNQFSTYAGGAGGFGGKRTSDKAIPLANPPARQPDKVESEKTCASQAALYRLSGDSNPLHIDPSFAAMGGFDTPILHGLCTFGHAVRHVLKNFADNDVTRFKSVKVRFAGTVLPGQTIVTEMWQNGTRVHFQCKVTETGNLAISGAYMDLHAVNQPSDVTAKQKYSPMQSDMVFETLKQHITPEHVNKIKGLFLWNITKDGQTCSQWTVDLKNAPGAVMKGEPSGKPDCTITLADDDMFGLATGSSNPQQLFMKGKLKVKGNIMLTQKLGQLFKEQAKL